MRKKYDEEGDMELTRLERMLNKPLLCKLTVIGKILIISSRKQKVLVFQFFFFSCINNVYFLFKIMLKLH